MSYFSKSLPCHILCALALSLCFPLSSLAIDNSNQQQGYVSLLKKQGGEWVTASYSESELNANGMLCVRFNNYWCIKSPMGKPTYWNGQIAQDSRGHAQFSHPKYAARAFVKLMHTYRFRHNLRSANEILNRYAPKTDTIGSVVGGAANPTDEYASKIAEELGKSADEDLALFSDKDTINKEAVLMLLKAFAKWEITAGHRVTDKVIYDGIALAGF